MKKKWIIMAAILQTAHAFAQIELRSEYLPKQKYIDDNRDKTDGKSSVLTTTFTATVPVSVKPTNYQQPSIWAATLNASYTSFSNDGIAAEALPKEMGSADLGVMYMTPLHENLCLLEELQPASTLPTPMLKNRSRSSCRQYIFFIYMADSS
jgi:hypothetical protein